MNPVTRKFRVLAGLGITSASGGIYLVSPANPYFQALTVLGRVGFLVVGFIILGRRITISGSVVGFSSICFVSSLFTPSPQLGIARSFGFVACLVAVGVPISSLDGRAIRSGVAFFGPIFAFGTLRVHESLSPWTSFPGVSIVDAGMLCALSFICSITLWIESHKKSSLIAALATISIVPFLQNAMSFLSPLIAGSILMLIHSRGSRKKFIKAIFAGLLIWLAFGSELLELIVRGRYSIGNILSTGGGRKEIWRLHQYAFQHSGRKILFGSGFSGLRALDESGKSIFIGAHSSFFSVVWEFGVVGVVILLGFSASKYNYLSQIFRKYGILCFGPGLVLFVSSLTTDVAASPSLPVITAIVVTRATIAGCRAKEKVSASKIEHGSVSDHSKKIAFIKPKVVT